MAKPREISILSLNGINFGCYTNNLAAYKKMANLMKSSNDVYIPSYSTINRAVVTNGDFIHVSSLLGQFIIKKHLLLLKGV